MTNRRDRRLGLTSVESQNRLFAYEKRAPHSLADLEAAWSSRRKYWARKLGRLRLGVEPIDEQLTRYRRVTGMLTAVPGFLSTVLFPLFAVFGRPGIGVVVAALFFLPIVAGAWAGYFLLQLRARRYLMELDNYSSARERLQSERAH
jgi:hypothetical protein